MSATVFNVHIMSEMRRILKGGQAPRPCVTNEDLNRVSRNLFGSVDPVQTRAVVVKELRKQQQRDCERWDFDFQAGKPRDQSNRYIWEKTGPQDNVPAAYAFKMPYISSQSDNQTVAGNTKKSSTVEPTHRQTYTKTRAVKNVKVVTQATPTKSKVKDSKKKVPTRLCNKKKAQKGEKGEKQPKITVFMKTRKRGFVSSDGATTSKVPTATITSAPSKRYRQSSPEPSSA